MHLHTSKRFSARNENILETSRKQCKTSNLMEQNVKYLPREIPQQLTMELRQKMYANTNTHGTSKKI